ncbi:DNA cytosine methyltransferase [Aquimarina sp. 2201CG5-10]|uniref:DNA cytosine methyltransferase n=1 Tax=Aquimarina callyspongiae TaxID=3098150 RepID=UPI0039FC0F9A
MDCTKKPINEEQRILSFCYGYGGLERGVNSVIPIKSVAYVEIEAFQDFNLVASMEAGLVDPAPIYTDIKTFDAKPFRNRIHGIIGGYPCQGESYAGKRQLWNDSRFIYPYIEKCINASRPLWCFFENVSGHLSGSFPYVLDSLRSMGYNVEAGLFTASEVGAPHERKRLFILALDDSTNGGFEWRRKKTKNENRKQGSRENWELEGRPKRSSQELGNSSCCDGRVISGSSSREQKFDEPCNNSNELSNSSSKRNRKSSKEYQTGEFITNGDQWPARQGQSQFQWEEPRTTKPGLGCTINGYNFRTELLRQYGNGVVSQQAAYAFECLLEKHKNNYRL